MTSCTQPAVRDALGKQGLQARGGTAARLRRHDGQRSAAVGARWSRMPALRQSEPATRCRRRHRRRRAGRPRAGDRAGPARRAHGAGGAPARALADPARPEPHPAHHGALPFLGGGEGRCARRAPFRASTASAGSRPMARCSAPTATTGCSGSWCAPSISPTTSGCRSTRRKPPCAGASASWRACEALYGWSASDVSQDDGGVTVVITERAGGGQRRLRGRLSGGLRRQPLHRARAGRHNADPVGP